MDGPPANVRVVSAALLLVVLGVGGCASWRLPQIDPSGRRVFVPRDSRVAQTDPRFPNLVLAQPRVAIAPGQIIAPVGSEVIMAAGISSPKRRWIEGQRIEWMISPESVGFFVDVSGKAFFYPPYLPRNWPKKIDNNFSIGTTLHTSLTITRGTPSPSDDVTVQRGNAWVSVMSPTEGTTNVTAFAPSVVDWQNRQATGTIHWVDAQWRFPPPAINPVGQRHVFTTSVARHTDGSPLTRWVVRYEILGGPPAGFAPDGAQVLEVPTDELGQASVEVFQTTPQSGTTRIGIQIIRPETTGPFRSPRLIVGSGTTTKSWTAPDLGLRVTGPTVATVGSTATYRIEVNNPGQLPSHEVTISGPVPAGLVYSSSSVEPQQRGGVLTWPLGDLAPGQSRVMDVNFQANTAGTANFCATARTSSGLSAQDCAATTISSAALDVAINGPQTATVGSTVQFDVVVTNRGTVAASGIVIRDDFDDGFVHQDAPSPIEADLGDVPAGSARRITITLRVARAGQLCHTVTVLGGGGVSGTARACLTATAAAPAQPPPAATVPQTKPAPPPATSPPKTAPPKTVPAPPRGNPAMKVEKSGPEKRRVGETASFVITVTNTGDVPLTNVRVSDTYALQLNPIKALEGFTLGRDELIWTLPRLEVGSNHKIQIDCQCVAVSPRACNRVSVISDTTPILGEQACLEILPALKPAPDAVRGPQPELPQIGPKKQPAPKQEPAQQQPPAKQPPPQQEPPETGSQLEFSLDSLDEPARVGREIRYRVIVRNAGETSDRNVRLSVTVPEGMSYVSSEGRVRHKLDGRTLRFDPVAEIRAGESLRFTVTARAIQAGNVQIHADLSSTGLTKAVRKTTTTRVLP